MASQPQKKQDTLITRPAISVNVWTWTVGILSPFLLVLTLFSGMVSHEILNDFNGIPEWLGLLRLGPCKLFIDPLYILKNLSFWCRETTSYWSSMGLQHLQTFGSMMVIRSMVIIQGFHEPIYRFRHPQRAAFSYLYQSSSNLTWPHEGLGVFLLNNSNASLLPPRCEAS